jgi:palmitoyltransferase
LVASNFTGLDNGVNARPEDDTLMYIGPAAAEQILQLSKSQLIDRLHERGEVPIENDEGAVYDDEVEEDVEEHEGQLPGPDMDGNDSEQHLNGSLEDDEESYQGPGDQERGLLTDVPLVLGPNEIEALPMIIQTGIVDTFATKPPEGIHENMQAIRANVLIAQESGRNLLRELLIFIAAWDLADDEVYFKMMMQIMEALLINGLIPCTYGWFQESGPYNNPRMLWSPPKANRWITNRAKDIISPSQAVMIKLLTQIFRAKQPTYQQTSAKGTVTVTTTSTATIRLTPPAPLTQVPGSTKLHNIPRVDIFVVRYIFGQFRLTVIPETCALIYLQGQIHAGKVDPEDFPLNLWDMERVYEGIYQFLEFFAVLTEAEEWKSLLIEWQITHELVALLRELHAGIPRGSIDPAKKKPPPTDANSQNDARQVSSSSSSQPPSKAQDAAPQPIAVERPYEPTGPSTSPPPPAMPLPSDVDPARFSWRNLKKLVVLVLSSLVWKSAAVQDQVRAHGGVEMILSCCSFDSHNPYIREHAIMCLRFLLEGNEANQRLVRELEAREGVPSEVLERGGWETFVDRGGKVGLRRKLDQDAGKGKARAA